jgi:indolepyruvate ferredoxin oxidoreductase
VAVATNRAAFRWGRVAAHDPAALEAAAGRTRSDEPLSAGLEELVDRRATTLRAYQGTALAERYRALVERVREAELRLDRLLPLTEAVARNYFRVLAYKDEYEVARLYTDGKFVEKLRERFEGDLEVRLHLAPPLFSRVDPGTGRPRKRRFGPWIFPVLRILARGRFLRGTPLDIFGYTEERRMERRLIREYESAVERLLAELTPTNRAVATEIASLPSEIRGFGRIKLEACQRAGAKESALWDRFLKDGAPALVDPALERGKGSR